MYDDKIRFKWADTFDKGYTLKSYTILSYQTTSILNYTTFILKSIVKGISCAFLWLRHSPYSRSIWLTQAEEQKVFILNSLVWPGLEPKTSVDVLLLSQICLVKCMKVVCKNKRIELIRFLISVLSSYIRGKREGLNLYFLSILKIFFEFAHGNICFLGFD